jgi:hypothetical protein
VSRSREGRRSIRGSQSLVEGVKENPGLIDGVSKRQGPETDRQKGEEESGEGGSVETTLELAGVTTSRHPKSPTTAGRRA